MLAVASANDQVPAEPPEEGGEAYETIPLDPPVAEAAAPSGDSTRLEEIVVTATKRKKAAREIPATMTVLDGEDLSRSGAQGQQDFLRRVPGVNFENYDFGSSRITIRGISAIFNGNQTTGVLFGDVSFVDFYLPRVALDPNPFDMQDVEVLKGPQGTLFGASALNGAIRYIPQPPQFGETALKYFAQYTAVADGGAEPTYGAALNTPIGGDDAAFRVMGFIRRSPGYIDDLQQDLEDVNAIEQDGFRATAAWQPGSEWNLSLMYMLQRTDKADASYADNYDGRLSRNNSPRQSPSHSWYDLASLGIGYDFSRMSFASETALVRKRYDMFFDLSRITNSNGPQEDQPSTIGFTDVNRTDTWSQEFRLVSPDGADSPWQWVGGIFGTRQTMFDDRNFPTSTLAFPAGVPIPLSEVPNLIPGAGGLVTSDGYPNSGQATSDVAITEIALFGELSRALGQKWEATLGGRYYRTRLGGTVRSSGALYQSFNQTGVEAVNRDEIREQGFNPKVSVSWQAAEDIRAYAAAARGFRIGGLQPPAFLGNPSFRSPPVFRSDTIWNYEAGLRTQWFEDTLRVDLTAFHVQWDDPQLLQVTQGNISSYVDNVGGARSDGVELSSIYRLPVPGLTLYAAGTYAKTATTVPFRTSGGIDAPAGTPWPLAPRWQTATELRYIVPLGNWQIVPAITHTSISKTTAYLLQGEVFGYQLWDAQVSAANLSLKWQPEVSLVLGNVADTRGVTSDQPVPQFSFNDVTYVTPRAVTLRIGGRF